MSTNVEARLSQLSANPVPKKVTFWYPSLTIHFDNELARFGSVRFNSVPFLLETCSYAPCVEVNG
ncbi:hypothetical protein SDJN02_04649 [Cucurbita argyrosperma subsp. argyrosperma]|nr:hypothetical protein SDJN02_04649 [Cucurbita argyrosperma subsp. argyrosperma]